MESGGGGGVCKVSALLVTGLSALVLLPVTNIISKFLIYTLKA